MRVLSIALATAALLLSGCDQMTNDEAFGSSFDKCLVKNAIRSGTNGDRVLAQTICERHYVREAREAEAQSGESDVSVDLPLQADGPQFSNGITVNYKNTDSAFVVKKIGVTVDFHKRPKGADGKWAADDPASTLFWTFPASIEPDENATFSGSFSDGQVPGRFYEGRVRALRVLPYN
jgi:hypothetical protein